jgi:hypothetical protein
MEVLTIKFKGSYNPFRVLFITELVFIGPGNRKIVLRGHLTRQYSLTGTFAVETWNNKGCVGKHNAPLTQFWLRKLLCPSAEV